MAETVERFGKTTRWFHWTFASCFLALGATGAALALRKVVGLAPQHVASILAIHKLAAVGLLLLPPIVWLSGRTAETACDLGQILRWSKRDLSWLSRQPGYFLRGGDLPPAGKLNAGQKLNGLATAGLSVGLALTGAVLWMRPGSLVAWFVHLALFLAWLPLFAGHLSLALIVPSTRPALRGILFGRVNRDWAAHHHPAWLNGDDEALEPSHHRGEDADAKLRLLVRG